MNLGHRGEALIKHYESLRLEAYQDTGGVWTVGWGHVATAKPGMEITLARANELFAADTEPAVDAVRQLVTRPLNQGQFDALVSFAFNCGVAAFGSSTLLERVNAGADEYVAEQLCRWVHDNGVPLKGLARRRVAEAQLYLED